MTDDDPHGFNRPPAPWSRGDELPQEKNIMERLDGEEGMMPEPTPEQVQQHVTIVFPPDGDVQITGNATIIQMLAAAKLLERAASGMLDQAQLSALQARQSLLAPLDHLPRRRTS